MYADGGGLYLQVTEGRDGHIRRSWIFRYAVGTRKRDMGLGPAHTISLAEAREAALAFQKQRLAGIDPIDHRKTERAKQAASAAKAMTFDQCAAAYIAAHRHTWRSERHAQQWPQSLAKYISPALGKISVDRIDTAIVVKALQPIWNAIPKTASRLRGRIESVLDWATVSGFRQGDNPARWAGHLEHLLASPRKLQSVEHHAAMPFRDIPAFMARLRAIEGTAARAVEFAVLTATRRGEVLGATWDELDLADRVWIIPPARMKAGKEHRVPLSKRAIAILEGQRAIQPSGASVFQGRSKRKLSVTALGRPIELLSPGVTLHGFRSSFRDWCGEHTNFPREVAEAALAHRMGDAVEQAYRRGDALEKRRKLMEAWAEYCARPTANSAKVTPIRGAQ
jgi:integrase